MKKLFTGMMAIMLVAAMLLGGCETGTTGSAGAAKSGESIKNLIMPILQTRELETFNVLHSQRAEDFENLANLVDGLLENDRYGALVPALAYDWGTEDGGLTWTFNLREGIYWVDMNGDAKDECVAQDFATGLEWVLNFYKNDSYNTSMPIEMIAGADEYYEWTKTLEKDEAMALTADADSKFMKTVGIEIPDDYTVVYKCITNKPYFDSVATYSCLYPMAQGMIDELGGPENVAAMDNTTMWYNGCYTMTYYVQRNEKIFTKNPLYWDTECELFDTVTYKMVDSTDVAIQLYMTGEVDYTALTESTLNIIHNNPDHEYYNYLIPDVPSKYSYQFHFNYEKMKEDGTPDVNWNTAIANTAFRKAWYYGLNLQEYYKRTNAITPMVCENNFYTMKGLVYTSDGTEYTELVREELGLDDRNGEYMVRLDADKFAEYKAQAIEELTALGVTFPVEIDHYIAASSQTALDTAIVLKQVFSDSLGDDFVVLNIKTYVSSLRQEVVNLKLQSIALNGWGADYGDPQNYLGQECYGDDNAYYSAVYSNINNITEETPENADLLAIYKEYTAMVRAADAITTDMDARYAAYAKAEAFMLDNVIIMPSTYGIGWALGKVDNSTRIYAMYGIQNSKMKNWKTDTNGYTTEEALANNEALNAGMK